MSTIAVGLRFWARRRHKLRLMADDWIAGLALVSNPQHGLESNGTLVHNKVLGYSSYDFTPEQTEAMGRTDSVSQIALDVLTNNTLACVKLSALFFYRRIFLNGEKRTMFGTTTWATIVVVILWLLYCTISFPFLYGLVISDFLLDVWILALPIPSILRLHTTLQKKLSIIGWSRCVNCSNGLITESFFYTMLEAGMALIAVNLPSLWFFSISLKTGDILRSVNDIV
ncbi:hypothetical protein F4819DRAFT_499670 [Hypoxylon fuscum]|nr:hypothetical protein F4819DRAFT_499670 [Hypoxylon fuscum]